MTCPNCNAELTDDAKFCENCGAEVPQTIFCPECGTKTSTQYVFCPSCGARLAEPEPEQAPEPAARRKLPAKLIVLGAGIAVVAALALVLALVFSGKGGGSGKAFALYLKDKEVFYSDLSKAGPWQVSARFVDASDIDNEDLASAARYGLGNYFCLAKDGKTLFFPDKVDDRSDGATMYYRNINKPKEDAVKLDSDVTVYCVNDSVTAVTYLKGSDNMLYEYDIKKGEKTKLAEDVDFFYVTDDGKKTVFLTDGGDLYMKSGNKDKEKLASDVDSLEYYTKDLSAVYYMKEGTLYKKTEGKDKEKLASDVNYVVKGYDSGELYFLKSGSNETVLMDYVDDDMKRSDEESVQAGESTWEIDRRNSLREQLESETYESDGWELCYYDGKEVKTLTDSFVLGTLSSAGDAAAVVYSEYNQAEVKKIKLSEIDSIYDVWSMVSAGRNSAAEWMLAVRDSASPIEQEDAEDFALSADGKKVYFRDGIPEGKSYGDLYVMTVSNGKAEKPELYDSDVYSYRVVFGDKLMYWKDVKNDAGDLYLNKEKVDYEVSVDNVYAHKDTESIFYYTDWNSGKQQGTLNRYSKGKSAKIADDVSQYAALSSGDVLYLYDYSQKYYKGDLYLMKNGKAKKLDEEVTGILQAANDSKYRGNTYYGW